MYPEEQPDWHPIKEGRAEEGGRMFREQDNLENGWLHPGLQAIIEVARKVAQKVLVQNMIATTLARI